MVASRADKIAILILFCSVIVMSVEIEGARDIPETTRVTTSHGTPFRMHGFTICCNSFVPYCCKNGDQRNTKSRGLDKENPIYRETVSMHEIQRKRKNTKRIIPNRKMVALRADRLTILILLFLVIMVSVEIGNARNVPETTSVIGDGTAFEGLKIKKCCNEYIQLCCSSADSAAQHDTKSSHELESATKG
ncbi:unnamed protein product [Dovyalis caffra]|uniref:Uncharacterized protein n=1 Tax=Dovyalis caffra TaxID=77055 RepID=A0AAV1RT87_9ROSI|nr:unnamed protein product [Dovyalis caffra]